MNRRIPALLIPLVALLLAALACNMPGSSPEPGLATMAGGQATPGTASPGTPQASVPIPGPGTSPTATGGLALAPANPSPAAPTQAASGNCTDLAKFVAETVPDDTQVPPNTPFMKTWTIQNVGTCTWSSEYNLVFSRGEQMGGTSPQPLGQNVPPNSSLQIYLPQTSPAEPGEHQGFWMLQNERGQAFGLGSDASKPFWVKIRVVAGAAAPALPGGASPTGAAPGNGLNLGPATRTWTFDHNNAPFYLGDDEDVSFEVDDGDLYLTAFEPSGDQWRVAEQSFIDNFALEARYTTGDECSGKDDYGLLVRAPRQSNGIIDSGYVFGFNCEGQFRVYRMDNGAYNALVQWTRATAIKPGPDQDNVMIVVGKGNRLQLYANDSLLFEFDDASYPSGLFGMMVGSGGTQDLEIIVRQLAVWDLP